MAAFFEALNNKTFKKIYGFKNLESDEKNANKCEMIRRRSRFFSLHRSKFDPNSRLSAATDSVHRYRKNRVKFIDRAFLNHLLKFYIKNFNSQLSFFEQLLYWNSTIFIHLMLNLDAADLHQLQDLQ